MTTVFNNEPLEEKIVTTEEGSDVVETHRTPEAQARFDAKEKENNQQAVVLDGPLSEIYTRALNIVFKQNVTNANAETEPRNERIEDEQLKEALEGMAASGFNLNPVDPEDYKEAKREVYVYLTNAKLIKDQKDVNIIVDKVINNKKKYNKVIVSIQQDNVAMNGRQAALESLCKSFGAHVVHFPSSLVKEFY